MGTASKVVSVVFRLGELTCAAIVLGVLSHFVYVVDLGHGHIESKIIYAEVWAALSLTFSIILIPPLKYSFYAFPLDLIMFIGWMVAFGLLCNLTGAHTCSSYWYWNYWGYYWGRFWYIPASSITLSTVGSVGCSEWRTALAFGFIGGFCWLANACIGLYVVVRKDDTTYQSPPPVNTGKHWWNREKQHNANPQSQQQTSLSSPA